MQHQEPWDPEEEGRHQKTNANENAEPDTMREEEIETDQNQPPPQPPPPTPQVQIWDEETPETPASDLTAFAGFAGDRALTLTGQEVKGERGDSAEVGPPQGG